MKYIYIASRAFLKFAEPYLYSIPGYVPVASALSVALSYAEADEKMDKERQSLLLDYYEGKPNKDPERLKSVMGLPNGHFCRYPRECIQANKCCNQDKYDRSCND